MHSRDNQKQKKKHDSRKHRVEDGKPTSRGWIHEHNLFSGFPALQNSFFVNVKFSEVFCNTRQFYFHFSNEIATVVFVGRGRKGFPQCCLTAGLFSDLTQKRFKVG